MRDDLLIKTPGGRLLKLMEECAEVQQATAKLIKFGGSATDGVTGIEYNNIQKLLSEMADLRKSIRAVSIDIATGEIGVGKVDMSKVYIGDE